ncbi:MAG: acyl-CoA thioesterase [Treponema sp.]|nr:acyl-CoA thioesterase [Treponema sp.]
MMGHRNLTAEIEFTVEFYDVDSMGIVWHGNYIKYFEKARCALLNRIGYGYTDMKTSGYAFPVTGISLKYIRSFKFGDKILARAILDEYENCLRIRYELINSETGVICTKGVSTQMAVNTATGDSCFTCPQIFIGKVERLLALTVSE